MGSSWVLKADIESLSSKRFPINSITQFSGKQFFLLEGRNVLGRDLETCQVVLPGAYVSREHAEIIIDEGIVTLRDLASSNGTFVNGVTVQEQVLVSGDVITFDDIKLVFLVPGAEQDQTIEQTPIIKEADRTMFRALPADRIVSGSILHNNKPKNRSYRWIIVATLFMIAAAVIVSISLI